jgi:hypothetical protein
MQLIMLRSTTPKDIIWFLMPAHMSFCHILGTRILIIIMHNFKFRGSSLRLRVNSSKYKALRLKSKDS